MCFLMFFSFQTMCQFRVKFHCEERLPCSLWGKTFITEGPENSLQIISQAKQLFSELA